MKTLYSITLLLFLASTLFAQESFSVCVVPDKITYSGRGETDIYGNPKKGANFVLSGYIYRGDYFDNNCPEYKDCGVTLVLTQNEVYTLEDSLEVIGRWDFRGFTRMDLSQALANGGVPTYSTHTFLFNDDFEDCPGCSITTDGKDFYGAVDNVVFKKSIIGATTDEFRLMRGEVEQIIYKQPENKNETGGYNIQVTFRFYKN